MHVHNACVGQRELGCSSSGEGKSQLLKDIISRGAAVTGSTFGTTGGGLHFSHSRIGKYLNKLLQYECAAPLRWFSLCTYCRFTSPCTAEDFYQPNFPSLSHRNEGQLVSHVEQLPPGPPTASWTLGHMSHIQDNSTFFLPCWQATISVSLILMRTLNTGDKGWEHLSE